MLVNELKAPVRAGPWIAIAALVLQACGGSGGDSASPSESASPLKLESAHVGQVSSDSLHAVEAPLNLAQHAAMEVVRLAHSGALQFEATCPGSGSARYALIDADGPTGLYFSEEYFAAGACPW